MVIAGFLNFLVKENATDDTDEIVDDLMQTEKTPTTYS
jgi:hypothetical protein